MSGLGGREGVEKLRKKLGEMTEEGGRAGAVGRDSVDM